MISLYTALEIVPEPYCKYYVNISINVSGS